MDNEPAPEWESLDFPTGVAMKSKSEKSFLNFTRQRFEMLQDDRLLVNRHHKMMAGKAYSDDCSRVNETSIARKSLPR
ncbi:hypothetical protein JHU04_003293 [Brenneria sp. 4F2]|nr:hypothetical protein [Brenneria bubanii]